MSCAVTDLMLANALSLAEQHLRAEGRVPPMFYLSGPGGEAVIRLDLTPDAGQGELLEKTRLMAAALAVEACAWVFETRIVGRGGVETRVAGVLCESRSGEGLSLSVIGEDKTLVPLASPLAAGTSRDLPSVLAQFLRREDDEIDPAEAWRRLEAMGVNRGDSRRDLN
jgi:hypothetical protein